MKGTIRKWEMGGDGSLTLHVHVEPTLPPEPAYAKDDAKRADEIRAHEDSCLKAAGAFEAAWRPRYEEFKAGRADVVLDLASGGKAAKHEAEGKK